MSDGDLNVLHALAADTPAARLETLRVLCARPEVGRQRVMYLGSGRIGCAGLGAVERLTAPFGIGRLAARRLRNAILATDRTVLHIWSAKALKWTVPALVTCEHGGPTQPRVRHRLLVDAAAPLDVCRLASTLSRLRPEAALRLACPTETRRRRLVAAGLPVNECVLIRDSVDPAAIDAVRASDVRPRLGLLPEHSAALVLPPVLRGTGAFVAAWATMLAAQVRPDVRLIVPEAGREVDRVARLVDSCRHRWLLRLAGPDITLSELVAAADLAIYLPPGDAPLSGVLSAMAARRPIVASAVPATAELLTHRRNAWLCQPNSPRDAARRMLQALDNPHQSRQQAEQARGQMFPAFGRRRMIEEYAQAYANLLANRPITDGIGDAALVG